MPKLHCTSRAEWRLQMGKALERLSAHYRLACDYKTPVMTCWEEGGSEPLYLCEHHAQELSGRRRETSSSVRAIADSSAQSDIPTATARRTEPRERADAKSNATAPAETARDRAEGKLGRAIKDLPARPPLRDLAFGNSAKAMVDEAIWNLAPGDYDAYRESLRQGKPAAEAAQAAGGQLAVVHRKIADYTLKLEALLSEASMRIDVSAAIGRPLEESMLQIISDDALNDPQKDAAIQRLGALEEWVKHGLNGSMSPSEANRILRDIGERLNWGGSSGIPEELKPAYRALYGSLKTAISDAVPETQNLLERLANLYAAKSDLENPASAKELNPLRA